MIQQKRLMDLFAGLVSIDNPSLHEAEMCARLKEELRALGAEPREDDTAAKIGGNAGNLYAYFEGSARTAYPAWPPFWRRCAR